MSEKRGVYTTEFWLTLASQVIPILVLTGVLDTDQAGYVQDTVGEIIKHSFALAALVVPVAFYIYGRAKVKTAALK